MSDCDENSADVEWLAAREQWWAVHRLHEILVWGPSVWHPSDLRSAELERRGLVEKVDGVKDIHDKLHWRVTPLGEELLAALVVRNALIQMNDDG